MQNYGLQRHVLLPQCAQAGYTGSLDTYCALVAVWPTSHGLLGKPWSSVQVVTGMDVFHGDEDKTTLGSVTVTQLQRKNQRASPARLLCIA